MTILKSSIIKKLLLWLMDETIFTVMMIIDVEINSSPQTVPSIHLHQQAEVLTESWSTSNWCFQSLHTGSYSYSYHTENTKQYIHIANWKYFVHKKTTLMYIILFLCTRQYTRSYAKRTAGIRNRFTAYHYLVHSVGFIQKSFKHLLSNFVLNTWLRDWNNKKSPLSHHMHTNTHIQSDSMATCWNEFFKN